MYQKIIQSVNSADKSCMETIGVIESLHDGIIAARQQ